MCPTIALYSTDMPRMGNHTTIYRPITGHPITTSYNTAQRHFTITRHPSIAPYYSAVTSCPITRQVVVWSPAAGRD